MTPGWILDVLAAVMLVVAAASAGRLVASPRWRRGDSGTDVDIVHLLMGIAMAGMLVSGLQTLADGAWVVIFAVSTAWFGWRVVSDARASGMRALARGHCAPHLVHCGAMVYMFAAMPAGGLAAMSASGTAAMGSGASAAIEYPTLAFVFVLVLAAYSVWDIDQLSGRRYSLAVVAPAGGAPAGAAVMTVGAPAVTVGCRVAMGIVMAFMLVIMI
jgi:hypothetical protein